MEIEALDISDVKLLTPESFHDGRGFFSETFNQGVVSKLGIRVDFVQDNHSSSIDKGTIRGLHFQTAPFALPSYGLI